MFLVEISSHLFLSTVVDLVPIVVLVCSTRLVFYLDSILIIAFPITSQWFVAIVALTNYFPINIPIMFSDTIVKPTPQPITTTQTVLASTTPTPPITRSSTDPSKLFTPNCLYPTSIYPFPIL